MPWLQDIDGDADGRSDVWMNSWDFEFRDVVIVDRNSTVIEPYNLTQNDLADSDNLETLKNKFIEAAVTPPATPWQQPIEPLDVDSNGIISPLDALLVINNLQNDPTGLLPDLGGETPPSYVDTNGDGYCAPIDALLVINQLIINAGLAAAPAAPLSATAAVPSAATANQALHDNDDATSDGNASSKDAKAVDTEVSAETEIIEKHFSQSQTRYMAVISRESFGDMKSDFHDEAIDTVLAEWDWL